MRDFSRSREWLSLNTATGKKQWPLDRIIDECAQRGIRAISPWRDQVAAVGLAKVAAQLRATDIGLSGYCRGSFSRRPTAQDSKSRSQTTSRRSRKPNPSGRHAWC